MHQKVQAMKQAMNLVQNKSLYGIKQAPRVFYDLVKEQLTMNRFQRSQSDHCVFTRGSMGM
jgi:hypothetical protein